MDKINLGLRGMLRDILRPGGFTLSGKKRRTGRAGISQTPNLPEANPIRRDNALLQDDPRNLREMARVAVPSPRRVLRRDVARGRAITRAKKLHPHHGLLRRQPLRLYLYQPPPHSNSPKQRQNSTK